jgi:AraC-like DNA-binding protein
MRSSIVESGSLYGPPSTPRAGKQDSTDQISLDPLQGLIEHWVNHPAFSYFRPLRRLREMIEVSYGDPVSLAQAAHSARLEAKYFSTYFRKKVGITFSNWLMMRRTLEAMKMMDGSKQTITDIALTVGLNICTFERSFKRLTGVTPRAYRKRPAEQRQTDPSEGP